MPARASTGRPRCVRQGIRDQAIARVLLFTGLRIAELVALDTGDLSVSARKGQLTVRRGKGERYRQVPVNAEARTILIPTAPVRIPQPATGPKARFGAERSPEVSFRQGPVCLGGCSPDGAVTEALRVSARRVSVGAEGASVADGADLAAGGEVMAQGVRTSQTAASRDLVDAQVGVFE